jgi:hypothetical protein
MNVHKEGLTMEEKKTTKEFHVKKFIAVTMIVTLCVLSLYQGLIEKKVPVEFIGLAGFIVGTYFKKGEGEV